MFFGIPIGSNPRRCETWRPMVDSMNKKFSSWIDNWLSLGGRVTLMNYVFPSLPFYLMSFYKAPKKIIKEIIQIDNIFCIYGNEDKRGINWIKCSNIFKPKEAGGLEVRNM